MIKLEIVLVDNGIAGSVEEAAANISKHVRWCRTNMKRLEVVHITGNRYVVDPKAFESEFKGFRDRKKATQKVKAERARALSVQIASEKAQGLRDAKGRLVNPGGGGHQAIRGKAL